MGKFVTINLKIPQCLENVIGNQTFKTFKIQFDVLISLSYGSLTLRCLSVYKFLYQGVSSLCVKAKRISQGLHVWALFQEVLFQPTSSSMEVLLK